MNWISVNEALPGKDDRVLVWVKHKNDEEFDWDFSELDSPDNPYWIEPNSGVGWLMGSAKDYEITHWAKIKGPNGKYSC